MLTHMCVDQTHQYINHMLVVLIQKNPYNRTLVQTNTHTKQNTVHDHNESLLKKDFEGFN